MKPVSGYRTLSRLDNDSSRPSISVRTRSGLTHYLVRFLVRPESAPRRMTQIAVVRPLRELDLADDGGADKMRERALGTTERLGERCRLTRERRQATK